MTQRRIYQCAHPYHITFNILNREWFFEDGEKAELLHEIILNASDIKNHTVYQFCIMPDHVHLLCRTNKDDQVVGPPRGMRNGGNPRTLENVLCGVDGYTTTRNVGFPTRGADQKHNISDFIKSIKGTFAHELNEGKIWQPRFHDEIIQTDQQLREVIAYITHTPIKAELLEKWNEYPYQYKNNELIHDLFF